MSSDCSRCSAVTRPAPRLRVWSTKRSRPTTHRLREQSEYLQYEAFTRYHSEHEMLRYLHRLQARDLSLTQSMIPLGSCTMKLNGRR